MIKPPVPQPILVVGYSARMLAELGVDAGYAIHALDYFGDSDLRALCPSQSLLRDAPGTAYSARALTTLARTIAAPAVIYGAGFEHDPDLVAELAQGRQLLGNSPQTLNQVRDPFVLAHTLQSNGFFFPATQRNKPRDGSRWLCKPLRSGGGIGVTAVADMPVDDDGAAHVYQEHIDGLPCSFTFIADGARAVLIGMTEQLIGLPEFGATGFRWCGNLTPPRLPAAACAALWAQAAVIADCLAAQFGLRGANTVDCIWRDEQIWVLEVNARPSASLELFGAQAFDWHVRGCLGELPTAVVMPRAAAGKAVVFARAAQCVGDTQTWHGQGIRDVPHTGEQIARAAPVCTLLVKAETPQACMAGLLAQKAGLAIV